jgi:transposase
MEATGVYWKPVWAVLEDDLELLLVNARHVKQVPGRKTDVSDAASLRVFLCIGGWLGVVGDAVSEVDA